MCVQKDGFLVIVSEVKYEPQKMKHVQKFYKRVKLTMNIISHPNKVCDLKHTNLQNIRAVR